MQWSPPKVSVPLLNLVDLIFQLQGRGWIRYAPDPDPHFAFI